MFKFEIRCKKKQKQYSLIIFLTFLCCFVSSFDCFQIITCRNYLIESVLKGVLKILTENDTLLLKNWLSQNKIEGAELSESTTKLVLKTAKEQILSVAFTMYALLNDLHKSTIWAQVLRDQLGESFITEKDAIANNATEWKTVSRLTGTRELLKDELTNLKKRQAAAKKKAVTTTLTQPELAEKIHFVAQIETKTAESKKATAGATLQFWVLFFNLLFLNRAY